MAIAKWVGLVTTACARLTPPADPPDRRFLARFASFAFDLGIALSIFIFLLDLKFFHLHFFGKSFLLVDKIGTAT